MNILITSIGSFSAKFVIETCRALGFHTVGIDINEGKYLINTKKLNAFYKVSKTIEEKTFTKEIIEIVEKEKINYIIPLTDLDVDFFSNNYKIFINIKVLVENFELIKVLRSKDVLYNYLKNNQIIKCIPTYSKNTYLKSINQFPAIAKKKNGRSSEGLLKIIDNTQLVCVDDNYILQPLIEGYIVTVDIINSKNKSIWIQRKEIFRTTNGAGITVEIINNDEINNAIKEFLRITNYAGVLNIEFIVSKDQVFLMDVNPRFSAGVAFSKIAGYDFVGNAIKFLRDEPIENCNHIYNELIITKEYNEIIIN